MRPIRAVLLCATFSGSSLTHTHTHIPVERPFFRDYPGEPVPERKPIWKQETVSGIRWTVCKSAPRSRQITTPAPYHSFLQAGCPSCGPTNSVKAVPTNRNYKYTQRYHISSSTRQSAATKSRKHCEYRDFGRAAIFGQRIMHKISKVEPLSCRLSSPLMAAFNARAETEIMSIM